MSVSRNYFQKFPAITYNDYVIRDISARAKINQYLQESGVALLPYTVKENERADNIAAFYYDDPFYAWAIYLANGIVDPYAEWPKDQQTFNRYIEAMYGSYEASLDEIVRYEVNWAEDTTLLSPDQYAALPVECRKYWEAQFGYNRQIISYFRKEVDSVLNNNRIDTITVVAANNELPSIDLTLGERMYQYNFAGDVATKATLVSVDSTTNANTVAFAYDSPTVFDINFESGNSTIYLKSTQSVLPRANISGTFIPSGTYITHIVDGTHVILSAAPTDDPPAEGSDYVVSNPATATLTLHKVDFNEVTFYVDGARGTPNSFFVYDYGSSVPGIFTSGSYSLSIPTETFVKGQYIRALSGGVEFLTTVNSVVNSTSLTMTSAPSFSGEGAVFNLTYHDESNHLVGRKSSANVIVLSHFRVDTDPTANDLLSNSHLSINELPYWKSVSAYDDEVLKNDSRKEIYVLDSNFIKQLDDALESILKNG